MGLSKAPLFLSMFILFSSLQNGTAFLSHNTFNLSPEWQKCSVCTELYNLQNKLCCLWVVPPRSLFFLLLCLLFAVRSHAEPAHPVLLWSELGWVSHFQAQSNKICDSLAFAIAQKILIRAPLSGLPRVLRAGEEDFCTTSASTVSSLVAARRRKRALKGDSWFRAHSALFCSCENLPHFWSGHMRLVSVTAIAQWAAAELWL